MNKQQVIEKFNGLPPKRKKVLLGLLRGDNREKIMVDADVGSEDALAQHKRKLYADFGIDTVQHELDDSRSGERKLHKLVALFAKYMPELTRPQYSQVGEALPVQARRGQEIVAHRRQDWGDAPDVPVFFGRTEQLATLQQWIVKERCRLVAIVGIAGIGKTSLSVKLGKGGIGKTDLSLKLARDIQDEFEYVIWRSLLNAPPVTEILPDLIEFLSNQQEINLSKTVDGQVSRRLHYLRQQRCLLILDNVGLPYSVC
jgi:hypothetical protein